MDVMKRYSGSLLGLAVGDAFGTAVEFKPRGSFEPVQDMRGGGPFNLEPGEWTDDTSMALCLAESLIDCNGFDSEDQMDRYIRWWQEGYMSSTGRCFDIGNTTREALSNYQETGEPYAGPSREMTAGNGSLMRLAPVPLFYFDEPEKAIEFAAKSSRTTHGETRAIDACRYYAGLLIGALNDENKGTILSDRYRPYDGLWENNELTEEIEHIASGSYKDKNRSEIDGSGYVVHTLEAVLWSFYNTDNFKEGILKVVNLGEDADTTGAIYGQLAGAYYGVESIPQSWKNKLVDKDLIETMANKLFKTENDR